MNRGSRSVGCIGLLAMLIIALVMGTVGGVVTGGALAYYFEQHLPSALVPVVKSLPTAPAPASTTQQPQVAQLEQSSAIVDAVKKVSPAVVTIVSTGQPQRSSPFRPAGQVQALGTGVIVDSKGYIVTNNHVIAGSQQIQVVFSDGSKSAASLIGADQARDLAVVQVTGRSMPAVAELGDSSALQVGEPVIAIGDALGDFQNTVTVGVVSALNRQVQTGRNSSMSGLIQTDADLNHGDSGGPLLNEAGQVIGINTLSLSADTNGDVAEGLGFAIPSNTVKQVSAQFIAQGT